MPIRMKSSASSTKRSAMCVPNAVPSIRPKSLMRVVLDINIIVSALLAPAGKPAAIIRIWLDGKFTRLTCADAPRRTAIHAAKAACG